MTSRVGRVEEALRVLASRHGGDLVHGARIVGRERIDGLDVEIEISVTRRVEHDETRFYHDEALDLLLHGEPYHTCQHSKANRGHRFSFGGKTTGCGNAIAAAIVYRRTPYLPWGTEGPRTRWYGFDFVCPSHRDHPRYAPVDIIEIVRFTDAERTAIRRAREKRRDEWYAKQRAEEKAEKERDS